MTESEGYEGTIESSMGLAEKRALQIKNIVIASYAMAEQMSNAINGLVEQFTEENERRYALFEFGVLSQRMKEMGSVIRRHDSEDALKSLPPEVQEIIMEARKRAGEAMEAAKGKKEGRPYA